MNDNKVIVKNAVETAMVMVAVIEGLHIKHEMTCGGNDPKTKFSAAQQYNEQKGLKKFGKCGEQVLVKEMSQKQERNVLYQGTGISYWLKN